MTNEWSYGVPVSTDTTNFEWSYGVPYIVTESAGGAPTANYKSLSAIASAVAAVVRVFTEGVVVPHYPLVIVTSLVQRTTTMGITTRTVTIEVKSRTCTLEVIE